MYNNNVVLLKSNRKGKKFKVILTKKSGETKTVHFGATGYSNFTKHKDPKRMNRYIARHKSRENWKKGGIDTAGFWSRWILWSKPDLKNAIKYTERKFGIRINKG
tara:strand:+ start:32 stop:346 length:315 start_codon:yes stop_codon:yes gene_type:complete